MRRKSWKIRAVFCAVLAAAGLAAGPAVPTWAAVAPEVSAQGYVILDADTGRMIAGEQENARFYPASTTKVLTALVVLEHAENLEVPVTFSHTAVTDLAEPSSTMEPRGREGEQMPLEDVLYGLILNSGNECANALAEYVSGSTEAFAALMNERAEQIGASGSNFVNAHGLFEAEHYSTPYDMGLIFREAMKNDTFRKIDTTREYQAAATNLSPERTMEMGHRMVHGDIACEGVIAGKTGLTDEGGRTLITEAERGGVRLIVVIMQAEEEEFYNDTAKLLDYGYQLLAEETAAQATQAQSPANSETAAAGGDGSIPASGAAEEGETAGEEGLPPETGNVPVTAAENQEVLADIVIVLTAACCALLLVGTIFCVTYMIILRKR